MNSSAPSASSMSSLTILEPAFDVCDVVVVLSTNDAYMPFVSTVLQSLLETSSPQRTYDVIVMHTDVTAENQDIVKRQMSVPNFSVRFLDITPAMDSFSGLHVHGHFKVETYFRLLIPSLLPWCDKALYLDADLVVLEDVANLYDTDLDGYLVGATHDADTAGQYAGFDPAAKHYYDEVLQLENPYDYFQAGVILMNLDLFRKTYTPQAMLEFAASHPWNLLDQDVLNFLAQGHVAFVDMAWNTLMDWQWMRRKRIIGIGPEQLVEAYELARINPKVVHYAGPGNKPWECEKVDMGAFFWRFADHCPYAEQIRSYHAEHSRSARKQVEQVGAFWLYHVVMPIGEAVAPPGSRLRGIIGDIYHRFGSWGGAG